MGEILKRYKDGRFLGYYLRFYEGGRRRVLASKQTSHTDARRMLLQIEARIARGEVGLGERRTAWPTVGALIERFLTDYSRPRLKDIQQYRTVARYKLRKVLPHIGQLSTEQIQQSDIVKLRDALLRSHAPGTVQVALAILSAVFSWGCKQELAPHNPCRGVERPSAPPALDYLTGEEVRRLLDGAEARATTLRGRMLHIGIALAVHTGLRKGELLGLRWRDLDLTTRRLTVARSYRSSPKSGKARHLRVPQALIPILQDWKALCPSSADGLVLPIGQGAQRLGSKEAMLGLPRLMADLELRAVAHPWHLLRHTMASHFVMAGGNILALQQILGHSDVKMTLLYAHLAPDFLDGELDRIRY